MSRPVVYDITHLATRLTAPNLSGIDNVDLAYARYWAGRADGAVHYGLRAPRHHPTEAIGKVLAASSWRQTRAPSLDDDLAFRSVVSWLETGTRASKLTLAQERKSRADWGARSLRARALLRQTGWRLNFKPSNIPANALYLNAAQHAFEFPRFFHWMSGRPDIRPVFVVHDLLPLDCPEYFRAGYEDRFETRVQTILNHAGAIITTTGDVARRIDDEYRRRNRPPVPVHVQRLTSFNIGGQEDAAWRARLQNVPYFLMLGTIEPRKNHLLALNVWQKLAEENERPPKLVIVGARGWENEQVVDILERSRLLAPHVIETGPLSDEAVHCLLSGARALLMPSFAEGFGLPVVEALAMGTPVIASDIPVLHEVSRGGAIHLHTLDGLGWKTAIEDLCDLEGERTRAARASTRHVQPDSFEQYFAGVSDFLHTL